MCVAGRAADTRGPCESTNSKITLRKRSVPMFSVEWVKPADRKRTSPGVNESSTGAAPLNDARVRPPLTNTDSMSRSCRWSTVAWPGGMSSKKMVTPSVPVDSVAQCHFVCRNRRVLLGRDTRNRQHQHQDQDLHGAETIRRLEIRRRAIAFDASHPSNSTCVRSGTGYVCPKVVYRFRTAATEQDGPSERVPWRIRKISRPSPHAAVSIQLRIPSLTPSHQPGLLARGAVRIVGCVIPASRKLINYSRHEIMCQTRLFRAPLR